jgi:hypothetical protein
VTEAYTIGICGYRECFGIFIKARRIVFVLVDGEKYFEFGELKEGLSLAVK